eukprot:364904-Chlamydomonas_euryale.AAC.19
MPQAPTPCAQPAGPQATPGAELATVPMRRARVQALQPCAGWSTGCVGGGWQGWGPGGQGGVEVVEVEG